MSDRLDRRALFASGGAAVLLAAAGVSQAQTPRRGGVMRIAVPRDEALLRLIARGAIQEKLTEIGPDGLLHPELATRWSCDTDAKHWRFDLREGTLFSDNRPMSSEDVVNALHQHFSAGRFGDLAVDHIIATGDLQVEVALSRGSAHLPYILAQTDMWIEATGHNESSLEEMLGTGPYDLIRANENRHFMLQRRLTHPKDGTAGWADQIEAVVIPDAAVRAEALRDGYVDIAALPQGKGLIGSGNLLYYPSSSDVLIAASTSVGMPVQVSGSNPMDDGRIALRWWML